jgi:hypothetical protein
MAVVAAMIVLWYNTSTQFQLINIIIIIIIIIILLRFFNILRGFHCPPGWGLGVRLITAPSKKILLRKLKRRPRPTQGCRTDDDDDDDDVVSIEKFRATHCKVHTQLSECVGAGHKAL